MKNRRLPTSLNVGGVGYSIQTDYSCIEYILECLQNPDYEDEAKCMICLRLLYKDFDSIPRACWREALERAFEFIDGALPSGKGDSRAQPAPQLISWEQDMPLIVSAINKALGYDIRTIDYMHWYTFVGYFMELDEHSMFAAVLTIRRKLREDNLEKHERKFYNENKEIIDIKVKYTESEKSLLREWGIKE